MILLVDFINFFPVANRQYMDDQFAILNFTEDSIISNTISPHAALVALKGLASGSWMTAALTQRIKEIKNLLLDRSIQLLQFFERSRLKLNNPLLSHLGNQAAFWLPLGRYLVPFPQDGKERANSPRIRPGNSQGRVQHSSFSNDWFSRPDQQAYVQSFQGVLQKA